ncbi:MAG: hypothetical protein EOO90_09540 [Pedobacter sp.]|nr:MAG: hypothetical protein EOO90_09540 [Pedobacter sp.]
MRNVLITLALLCFTFNLAAQTDSSPKSVSIKRDRLSREGSDELKVNVVFTAMGLPEITYERILRDNTAVGVSLLVGAESVYDFNGSITPYHRWYFGNGRADGFFIEGSASAISAFGNIYYDRFTEVENQVIFGLGAAVGTKFFSRNGFFGEAYIGMGRSIGRRFYFDNYPRFGLVIGKRLKTNKFK